MKKTLIVACVAVLAGLGAAGAQARGHGHGHVNFGVYVDPFWWGPRPWPYYDPWWYEPPRTVVIEREPSVYIQQQPPAPQPAPEAQTPAPTWYWCPKPAGYYPHVPQCPQPWVPVDPRSLPPTGGQ